jgi:hypothetical protein
MHDFAIEKAHLPFCMLGNIGFMRYQYDRNTFLVQAISQLHNFFTGLAVQVAGRFIGQNQSRFIYQCACNRHALLLPT